MDTLSIAVVQMASKPDPEDNVRRVKQFFEDTEDGTDLIVFPENVLCLGRGASVRAAARTMPDHFASLGVLCREYGIAALFGGVPVADADGIANASLAFDTDGTLLARYDKMHLFQLDPGRPGGVDETRVYSYGPGPLDFEFRGWKIGLSICYDMRFPELFRVYAPCDLLICTAAFTATTGRAHWEVLLRARAIENLCYMAASAQCGTNTETGIDHFGESMIVDPWGDVVGCVPGKDEGIARSRLSRSRIAECRRRLPALKHRRIGLGPDVDTGSEC